MDIRVNEKKIAKDDLNKLIAKNKLQAIVHIRSVVNIGLKDAKEIVDNLEKNPNHYDNSVINIAEKEFVVGEAIAVDLKNGKEQRLNKSMDKKVGSHIIRNDNPNKKWIYIMGFIFMIILLYFLIVE